ncbi:MAG: hypothetical protein HYX28_09450 [Candidatus Koribacter versatilis]|uniref:Uncharacterized protein n=1 Tax=Candidatus Korobacter versatilis TaxID=658062 RepID=A0A932AA17_9BACT|nr:hypothetical protein [Candidatus Koribacter versatilis]
MPRSYYEQPLILRIVRSTLVLGVPVSAFEAYQFWREKPPSVEWGTEAWLFIVILGVIGSTLMGVVAGFVEHVLVKNLKPRRTPE